MAFDLGTLLTAGARGAAGYQEGKNKAAQQRLENERRARLDMIAQQIADANIQNLQSQAAARQAAQEAAARAEQEKVADDLRRQAVESETANYYAERFPEQIPQGSVPAGEAVRVGRELQTAQIKDTGEKPGYQLVQTDQGYVWVPKPGTRGGAVDTGLKPKTTGAQTTEQQVLSAARTMVEAARTAGQLEDQDPQAAIMPVGAAAVRGVGNLPIVGGLARGLTDPAAQGMLSPAQQQFRQAADVFTHNYVATLPRSRVSPQLIEQIRDTFFPRAGQTDPRVIRQFREKRERAAQALLDALEGKNVDFTGLPGLEGLRPGDLIPSGGGSPENHPPANPFAGHPWSQR